MLPIPRNFEFAGDEVIMRKVDDRLIIEPVARQSLLELLASPTPLDKTFSPIEDLPPSR